MREEDYQELIDHLRSDVKMKRDRVTCLESEVLFLKNCIKQIHSYTTQIKESDEEGSRSVFKMIQSLIESDFAEMQHHL